MRSLYLVSFSILCLGLSRESLAADGGYQIRMPDGKYDPQQIASIYNALNGTHGIDPGDWTLQDLLDIHSSLNNPIDNFVFPGSLRPGGIDAIEVAPAGPYGNATWDMPDDLDLFRKQNPNLQVFPRKDGKIHIRYAPADDVPWKMNDLINKMNRGPNCGEPLPEYAKRISDEFISIHPFTNGNGRTGDIVRKALIDNFNAWEYPNQVTNVRVVGSVGAGFLGGYVGSQIMQNQGGFSAPVSNGVGGTMGGEIAGMIVNGGRLTASGFITGGAVSCVFNQASENHRLPGSRNYEMDQVVKAYEDFKNGRLGSLGSNHSIEARPRTLAESIDRWMPWFFGGGWGR